MYSIMLWNRRKPHFVIIFCNIRRRSATTKQSKVMTMKVNWRRKTAGPHNEN